MATTSQDGSPLLKVWKLFQHFLVKGQNLSENECRQIFDTDFKLSPTAAEYSRMDFDSLWSYAVSTGHVSISKSGVVYVRPTKKSKFSSLNRQHLVFLCAEDWSFKHDQVQALILEKQPVVLALLLNNSPVTTLLDAKDLLVSGYDIFRHHYTDHTLLVYLHRKCRSGITKSFVNEDILWLQFMHPDSGAAENDSVPNNFQIVIGFALKLVSVSREQVTSAFNTKLAENPTCNVFVIGTFGCDNKKKMPTVLGPSEPNFSHLKLANEFESLQYHFFESCSLSSIEFGSFSKACELSVNRSFCQVCRLAFLSDKNLDSHRRENSHLERYKECAYKERRDTLLKAKFNLFVEINSYDGLASMQSDESPIHWKIMGNSVHKLHLVIKNRNNPAEQPVDKNGTPLGIVVQVVDLVHRDPDVSVSDDYGITLPSQSRPQQVKRGIRLVNGEGLTITIRVEKNQLGLDVIPLFVMFFSEVHQSNCFYVKEVIVNVRDQVVTQLDATEPYQRPEKTLDSFEQPVEVVPCQLSVTRDRPEKCANASLKVDWNPIPLSQYLMKEDLKYLLDNGMRSNPALNNHHKCLLRNYRKMLYEPLSIATYAERFSLLLYLEEYQLQVDIRNYDLQEVTLESLPSRDGYKLSVPGLEESRPSLLTGDHIYVRQCGRNSNKEFEGIVTSVQDTCVLLVFSSYFDSFFMENMKFNVRFSVSRYPIRTMHRALGMVQLGDRCTWNRLLFPTQTSPSPSQPQPDSTSKIQTFFNPIIKNNIEQQRAVNNIVSGGIQGVPYILFGPPGTGKTVTVVECVKQIWFTNSRSHILVTAPNNSAADLLAQRLMDHIPATQMLRLYASCIAKCRVPDNLLPIACFAGNVLRVDNLMSLRIIICTMITSSKLVTANFPSGHFTHVFIDEAGQATEPECLVCLTGRTFSSCQVVLAGDPKQLGPVLLSPLARRHGLDKSILERLIEMDMYANRNGSFNEACIVKLLDNFRCHEKLLTVPNELFYDSELRVKADPLLTNCLLHWPGLGRKGFPILFHGVVGEEKREGTSPSWFNPVEVKVVVDYVQQLLSMKMKAVKQVKPQEIGIISPYRKQVQRIRQQLQNQLHRSVGPDIKDVKVGSTEEFQGQERKVIILSTVRSQVRLLSSDFSYNLGFVNNPKRFNVATTRTRALLIIVGNAATLCIDANWAHLLRYIIQNGGYKGVDFKPDSENEELEYILQEIASSKFGVF